MLVGIVEFAAERRAEVGVVAGGVGDEIVAPIIEGAAVRVREVEATYVSNFPVTRFEAIDRAVDVAHGAGDRLDLRYDEKRRR